MVFVLLTLSASYILWVKNPLHAVLGLILVFLNSAILLLSIDVNFIALVYVVPYVGAICVLFPLVVMLLNLRAFETQNRNTYRNELIPFILSFLISLVSYFYTTITQVDTAVIHNDIGLLFTDVNTTNFVPAYLFQTSMVFVLLTLLLLLAIVSPIMIASKTTISLKKQDLFSAISRSPKTISSCFLLFIPVHSEFNVWLLFLGLISGTFLFLFLVLFLVLFFSGKNDPEKNSQKKNGNGGNGGNEEDPKNPDFLPPPTGKDPIHRYCVGFFVVICVVGLVVWANNVGAIDYVKNYLTSLSRVVPEAAPGPEIVPVVISETSAGVIALIRQGHDVSLSCITAVADDAITIVGTEIISPFVKNDFIVSDGVQHALHTTLFSFFKEGVRHVVLLKDVTKPVIDDLEKQDFLNWCNMWCDIHDAFFEN